MSSHLFSNLNFMKDIEVPKYWTLMRQKWTIAELHNGVWGNEPNGIDDIICIRVADFDRHRNIINDKPKTRRAIEKKYLIGRKLEKDDLLLEKSGGGEKQIVGCVVRFQNEYNAVCSNFIARMKVKDDMSPNYLVYLHASLYARRFNILAIKQTTGIQNLDTDIYLNFKVAIPPLEIQKKIANYLDKETARIDALIEEKQKMLDLLEEKRTALISSIVTRGLDPNVEMKPSGVEWFGEIPKHWQIIKLKFLVNKIGSGITPKGGARSYVEKGIPLLRSQNIHFNGLKMEDVVFIDEATHEKMSNSKVRYGDVLLNITGASLGRCYYINDPSFEANVNQHVCIIRPMNKIKTNYLYYILRSYIGQFQIHNLQSGSGREGLNFESIREFQIPLPMLKEQNIIIDTLKTVETQIQQLVNNIKTSIQLLKERRTALITAAVTGQLDIA